MPSGAKDDPVRHAVTDRSAMHEPYRSGGAWTRPHDVPRGAPPRPAPICHAGHVPLELDTRTVKVPLMSRTRVLAVVPTWWLRVCPARTSTLAGLPLVAHSLHAAALMRTVTRCIVSTDDPGIARVAREHGGDVPWLRPRSSPRTARRWPRPAARPRRGGGGGGPALRRPRPARPHESRAGARRGRRGRRAVAEHPRT